MVKTLHLRPARKGNYQNEATATYRIISAAQNLAKAKLAKKITKTYTGSAIKLTDDDLNGLLYFGNKGSATLVAGTNFAVKADSYVKNVKKGTAKVTLTGLTSTDSEGNEVVYGGSKTVSFKITQKKGTWNSKKTFIDGAWTN